MINILKQKVETDPRRYSWLKYNAIEKECYKWSKYKIDNEYKFKYDRYNTNDTQVPKYYWKVYNHVTRPVNYYGVFDGRGYDETRQADTLYYWKKYSAEGLMGPHYTWVRSYPLYLWNKYTKIENTGNPYVYELENYSSKYTPQNATFTYDSSNIGKITNFNITDYTANLRYITMATANLNTMVVGSDYDKPQNWRIEIRFYGSAVVNPDTGAVTYSNQFQYNGNDFVATLSECHQYYDRTDNLVHNVSNQNYFTEEIYNKAPGTKDTRRFFYTTGPTYDTETQYVFSNNLIDLTQYPYMVLNAVYLQTGQYRSVPINNVVFKIYPNSTMIKNISGTDAYMIDGLFVCAVAFKSTNQDFWLTWEVTNVDTTDIIRNVDYAMSQYKPGYYIETVSSSNPNAYPSNGYDNDYFYISKGVTKGNYDNMVYSDEPDTFPDNDEDGGWYYSNKAYVPQTDIHPGVYLETISSTDRHMYPDNDYVYPEPYDPPPEPDPDDPDAPDPPAPPDPLPGEGYWWVFDHTDQGINTCQTAVYYPVNPLGTNNWENVKSMPHIEVKFGDNIYWTEYISPYYQSEDDPWEAPCNMTTPDTGAIMYLVDGDEPETITVDNWSTFFSGGSNIVTNGVYSINSPYTFTCFVGGYWEDYTPSQGWDHPVITRYEEYVGSITVSHYCLEGVVGYTIHNLTDTSNSFGLLNSITPTYNPNLPMSVSYFTMSEYQELDYIDMESSYNLDDYPQNGPMGNYWYVYYGTQYETVYSKGTFSDFVESYSSNYPTDGLYPSTPPYAPGYPPSYIIYRGYTTTLVQGDYLEDVYDEDRNKYPINGPQDGYWYVIDRYLPEGSQLYVYPTYQYIRGDLVGYVTGTNVSALPTNGVQDGFWYVLQTDWRNWLIKWSDPDILGGITYKQNVNPKADYIIGTVASASIEFTTVSDEIITGETFKYYSNQTNKNDLQLMGVFNVVKSELQTKGGYKITAYDNLTFFDEYVDDWLSEIEWPITLGNLFTSLCENFNLVADISPKLFNQNYRVQQNFDFANVTGKQMLAWIAEAAGGYACATEEGHITIRYFEPTGIELDNSKYKSYTFNDWENDPVYKVIIQMSADDAGFETEYTYAPRGNREYHIINNPLFYNESAEENKDPANYILHTMIKPVYVPGQLDLLHDHGIRCGNIITIDDNDFYVMEKTVSPSGCVLKCVGTQNSIEDNSNSIDSQIISLRGMSNKLTRDLEHTTSLIEDVENNLQSQINQTASELNMVVRNVETDIATMKLSTDGIRLAYNTETGTASLTIGGVTVDNLTSEDYVDAAIAGVELNGLVRINDLAQSGSTMINGDNITTGIIKADRLDLTGAISWSDLSEDTKTSLREMTLSGAIPEYIHETYIDNVTIYSPKLYGAQITAGDSAQGYIDMSSSGLNFKSSTGDDLIGMGFYAGNRDYPYITFGQGIDSLGTDKGMIKKYENGLWIGDSDGITSTTVGSGTGIYFDFSQNKIYKYENGTATQL